MSLGEPNLDVVRKWTKAERAYFARRYPRSWERLKQQLSVGRPVNFAQPLADTEHEAPPAERLEKIHWNRERHLYLVRKTLWNRVQHTGSSGLRELKDLLSRVCIVPWAAIASEGKGFDVIPARQAFMYLAKKYTNCPNTRIAKFLGGRDRTTVLHGCREVERCLNGEGPEWKADAIRSIVSAVEARLK